MVGVRLYGKQAYTGVVYWLLSVMALRLWVIGVDWYIDYGEQTLSSFVTSHFIAAQQNINHFNIYIMGTFIRDCN